MRQIYRLSAVACTFAIALALFGAEKDPTSPEGEFAPGKAPPGSDPAIAAQRIRLPQGLKAEVFAAEPMLANPVCFCVDEHNRFYVAETYRYHDGVTDSREHMDWLDDDLACRTVADREAMLRKHLGDKVGTYEVASERIRLIEDVDGDGKADRSTVFAEGFNHLADGLGAGLLARQGNVWYTCIPSLWRLRDTKGTGTADERQALLSGFGVHGGFIGHDLHGLRMGPDGKLYFSSGDRGLHVTAGGKTTALPDTGSVLRCNPDGSDLEVVATGLRNPQELTFDQFGNLFTGDNNADHGDKARWVYVVEGGDSGWRMGYQYMDTPVALGPWNAEKLWEPAWDGQAAYIVPPVANVADGPAGLTYYPGTGRLPARYRDHFFLCDFRGSSGQSGIRSFAVKPKGASFEMVDQHEFAWSVLATDVDFGMDGALYLTDWVDGWDQPKKGRLFKIHDPALAQDPDVASVKKLMAEGFAHRSLTELAGLLEHPDMRVRQEAQFALADQGPAALPILTEAARPGHKQLARLHAIWGLGQVGRKNPEAYSAVLALTGDSDAEVRTQAARVLGDGRVADARAALVVLLRDSELRVRLYAALALGRLGQPTGETLAAVLQMLRENADRDPYLRHAGVMALAGSKDPGALLAATGDASPAVRLGVLLALRRLESPELARFLNDPEPRLVLEAARAIYDVPIPAALPQLANLITRPGFSEPLLWRVLNAQFRLGKAENAAAVAAFSARPDAPETLRIEALTELAAWSHPAGRDRVVGLWRPLEPRPANLAADAVRPLLAGIFSGPEPVRLVAARLVGQLGLKEAGPLLQEHFEDKKCPPPVRVAMLQALETLQDGRLTRVYSLALADADPQVRLAGLRLQAKYHPAEALAKLETVLDQGQEAERQGALSILGDLKGPAVDALLARWLDRLQAGQVPAELRLDLLEAAARHPAEEVKHKLDRYEASRPAGDLAARYSEALTGGDAEAGLKIFLTKAEVSCVRCHRVHGQGGEVGPDLTGIGVRQKREYLLEAIVDPNRQIAKGFETLVLSLTNGKVVTGLLKADEGKQLRLITAEGKIVTVAKDQIEEQARGKSAMPADLVKYLSKSDLRNLVEFLAELK